MLQSTSTVPNSGCKPRLIIKANCGGIHGDTLGRYPLPEGIAGESPVARALLPLAPCPLAPAAMWLPPPMVPAMMLVVFLICACVGLYAFLAMVYPTMLDLAVVVWLS